MSHRGTSDLAPRGVRRRDAWPLASAKPPLYSVYAALVLTGVYRFYGFPERSRAFDVSLFALPFLLACTFLALGTALCTRRETAMQVPLFTSLPFVFLAGFAWPLEAVSPWLRATLLFVPSTSGIAGFLRLTEMGAPLRQVRFEWLVLWALTAAYLLLAWLAAYSWAT